MKSILISLYSLHTGEANEIFVFLAQLIGILLFWKLFGDWADRIRRTKPSQKRNLFTHTDKTMERDVIALMYNNLVSRGKLKAVYRWP